MRTNVCSGVHGNEREKYCLVSLGTRTLSQVLTVTEIAHFPQVMNELSCLIFARICEVFIGLETGKETGYTATHHYPNDTVKYLTCHLWRTGPDKYNGIGR